jgi:hypothetical protein
VWPGWGGPGAHPAAAGTAITAGSPAAGPVGIALDRASSALTVTGSLSPQPVRERLARAGIEVRAEVDRGAGRFPTLVVDPGELARAARLLHAFLLEPTPGPSTPEPSTPGPSTSEPATLV